MYKTILLCCLAVAAFALAYSCSSKEKPAYTGTEKNETTSLADTSRPHSLSSLAAVGPAPDGMRFIRTADAKFEVPDVTATTYQLEDITVRYDGFVTYTGLHTIVDRRERVPISADSSLDMVYYTVQNDITLRIPDTRLDSALRAMSSLVGFLDHRIIRAEEVSRRLLAAQLSEARHSEYERRMAHHIDSKQVRAADVAADEDRALQGRTTADEARLAALALEDQVRYSTVHLLIYQRESVSEVQVASSSDLTRYQPSLGRQFIEAFASGWGILRHVLLFLAECWAFILIAVIAWVLYRRYRV